MLHSKFILDPPLLRVFTRPIVTVCTWWITLLYVYNSAIATELRKFQLGNMDSEEKVKSICTMLQWPCYTLRHTESIIELIVCGCKTESIANKWKWLMGCIVQKWASARAVKRMNQKTWWTFTITFWKIITIQLY